MITNNNFLRVNDVLGDDYTILTDRRFAPAFTEEYLIPAITEASTQGNALVVDLNGFSRYTRSWLYEMINTLRKHQLLHVVQVSVEFIHELESYPELIRSIIDEIKLQTLPVSLDSVEYSDNSAFVEYVRDSGGLVFGLVKFTHMAISYSLRLIPSLQHKEKVLLVLPTGELALGRLSSFRETMCIDKIPKDVNNIPKRYAVITKTLLEKCNAEGNGHLPYVLFVSHGIKVLQEDVDYYRVTFTDNSDWYILVSKKGVTISPAFRKHIKDYLPKGFNVKPDYFLSQTILEG